MLSLSDLDGVRRELHKLLPSLELLVTLRKAGESLVLCVCLKTVGKLSEEIQNILKQVSP